MYSVTRNPDDSGVRRNARMPMKLGAFLLGSAACVFVAGPAFAQDQSVQTSTPPKHHHHVASTGSDRLDLLERRVEQQAQKIDEQEQEINALKGGQGQVSSAQFEALQNQVYETQATVKAAVTPHDKKIHFKGITFTFGGFLAMESVFRTNNLESDIGSPGFSTLPFPGPGGTAPVTGTTGNAQDIYHTREFRFTARQSRVSGLAEGDDGDIHLAGYGEFDFLGAAASANSRESNSYTPRVRNLYGTVDWTDIGLKFLFGQSWSLATLDAKGISERTELAPPTIEAQYVDGFVWTRQPQLRVVKSIGDSLWLGLSLENPQNNTPGGTAPTGVNIVTVNGNSFSSAGSNATADAEFNPGIQLSLNQVPDVIGKVAWEPDFFDGNVHLELMGMERQFYDRIGSSASAAAYANSASNHTVSGGGGGVAGLIKLWPSVLDLQFDTLFGSGIGRYGSGQLPDVTFKADGTLQPLNENMEMVGLTLHGTPDFDFYVFGGREQEDKSVFTSPNQGGYGNINVSTAGCQSYNLTASCKANVRETDQLNVGLWDKFYNGDYGSARFGLQYSYTRNYAFNGTFSAGVFTNPHTSDNMIFTSFRYYPF